jgi:glycosyltransferase involved in cell wall biosynthesis
LQDGVNGYLVPRLEVKVMAEKINKLFDDPKLASELGQNGREFVQKNMNEETYLSKLLKIYQETVHSWKKEMVFA